MKKIDCAEFWRSRVGAHPAGEVKECVVCSGGKQVRSARRRALRRLLRMTTFGGMGESRSGRRPSVTQDDSSVGVDSSLDSLRSSGHSAAGQF